MTDEDKKIVDTEATKTHIEEVDDVVFEDNTEVTGADYSAKVKQLKDKIKELEKKNTELLDGWQRDKADFVNAKRQADEDRKEFMKFAKADLINELLGVLDSFDGAFKNKEAWEKVDKNWRVGVEYIHSQLLGTLTQNGVTVLNPIGESYDPKRDEAIENIKVDDEKSDGKILEVVQVGYALNGKELRAPKVRVGHLE
ncbi:MAG: nucleotide exchange factor GrpE [Patescibacteria group bacterium]